MSIDGAMSPFKTFQLDIDEVREAAKDVGAVETVDIVCTDGCAHELTYSERFQDTPLAAFVLTDAAQDIVTLWTNKNGYAIRIYHVTRMSITKVLDEDSMTAPEMDIGDYGVMVVKLSKPGLGLRYVTQVWRWDGKNYRMMPGTSPPCR